MSECIEWWGRLDSKGYGVLYLRGKSVKAHRMVWQECFGPIPEDRPFILHSCDNPPCVNPEHLRPGTPQENMDDKMRRGRWKGGRPEVPVCAYGHEMSGDNLRIYNYKGREMRVCRACARRNALAAYYRRKAS